MQHTALTGSHLNFSELQKLEKYLLFQCIVHMVNSLCILRIHWIDHLFDKYLGNTVCQRFTKMSSISNVGGCFAKMAAILLSIFE